MNYFKKLRVILQVRNLETELSGLVEWMRQRVGHQQKLLELHGRLSIIGEQVCGFCSDSSPFKVEGRHELL